jgi:D-alanine-D-alanine ligase
MKNIAIIMGGYSSEFEISLKSGGVVYQFLDKTKYNGFRVHILRTNGCMSMHRKMNIP